MADTTTHDVGSSVSWPAIGAAIVAVVLLGLGFLAYRSVTEDEMADQLVIATGPESGTYHALGVALGRMLENEGLAADVIVRATEGSVTNMGMIESEAADLAIIQSDTPTHENARLIARLYDEVLHILVARGVADDIRTVYDLEGRRVSIGGHGSGTRLVAETVLEHFRIRVAEDMAMGPKQTVEALSEGTIDAAFLLTAIPSSTVERLVEDDAIRFLSLGNAQEIGNEADALALVFPALHATTIPRATYATLPIGPVRTIGVSAQLIASRHLGSQLVQRITEEVFQHRTRLAGKKGGIAVAKRIRENYEPGSVSLPYHPGAVAYYERSQPPFFVEYAEAMSFGLTLLVGLYSGYIAIREWMRRRRKNRIDEYYMEAVDHAISPGETDIDILTERRRALLALRRTAFTDLVNEKLEANESFAILQDYINAELETINRRVRILTSSR